MVNLIWDAKTNINGTSLRLYVDTLSLEKIATLSGIDPHANDWYDEEKGYDGWEIPGTFNGEVFNLYTRFGRLRIGGTPDLDAEGLLAVLNEKCSR